MSERGLKRKLMNVVIIKKSKQEAEIWISKMLNVNEEILKDTLIHEMIHQYVYERLYGLKYQFYIVIFVWI